MINSPAILPRPFSIEDGTRLLVTNKTSLQSGPSWECSNITTEKNCKKMLLWETIHMCYLKVMLQTSIFLPAFFMKVTFLSESFEFLQYTYIIHTFRIHSLGFGKLHPWNTEWVQILYKFPCKFSVFFYKLHKYFILTSYFNYVSFQIFVTMNICCSNIFHLHPIPKGQKS